MCSYGAVALGVAIAAAAVAQTLAVDQARRQQEAAQIAFDVEAEKELLRRGEILRLSDEEREKFGEERFRIAREAQQRRGILQASGLASVGQLVAESQRRFGREEVALGTNIEFAQNQRRADLSASVSALQSNTRAIRSSLPTTGQIILSVFAAGLGGAASGLSATRGLGDTQNPQPSPRADLRINRPPEYPQLTGVGRTQ